MANFRQRGNRWQARVTVDGLTVTETFSNKSDAQRWARLQQADMERGTFVPARQALPLSALIGRYITEVLPGKRGRQQEQYILKAWQRRPLAKLDVSAIKPPDIAKARDARLQEVSASSVRREFDILSAVFTVAVKEWELCDNNPFHQIRKPAPGKARDRCLREGELDRIIAASESPDFAAIVTLANETAMRRSEILGLRWEYVDLVRRVAHLPLTKNGSSRDVPLSPAAIDLLAALPRRIDGKVFSKNGTSMSGAFQRAARRARARYVEECSAKGEDADKGYLVGVRLHDVRHSAVTRLFGQGFNVMEVAAISGHRTLAMLKRYTHLRAEDLARKLAKTA
jgi:integrase